MKRSRVYIIGFLILLVGVVAFNDFSEGEGRGNLWSTKAIKALGALIDADGEVDLSGVVDTLAPADLSGVFDSTALTDTYRPCYDAGSAKFIGCQSTAVGTDEITFTQIDENKLGVKISTDCTLLQSYVIGQVCIDSDDNSIWRSTNVANPGTWVEVGCLTDYTNLIVDGDTTPGGLDTSNPTSTDYVYGTGLTATVTGTDTAPIVTIDADAGVVGSYVLSRQWTDVNVTGSTNETNGIVYTLPAGTLGANDGVRITAQFENITYSGTGNVTLKVYFGTTVVAQTTVAAAQNRLLRTIVFNTGSVSAQEYTELDTGSNSTGTAAQNTAADVTIKATIQLNDAASSFDSSMLLVEHLR